MPASPVANPLIGNPILDDLDGGRKWVGVITYNRVEATNSVETEYFKSELPTVYATDSSGLTEVQWAQLGGALALMGERINFNFASTNNVNANYFVSDFYKPSNEDVAGIAAEPGDGTLMGFNVRTWDEYSFDVQIYIVLHEVGHTLGLDHTDLLPASLDYAQYTVMSYDWYSLGSEEYGDGTPITPMALDLGVLQAKYGAVAANTGATTYLVATSDVDLDGSDGTVANGYDYICIWDTGGADALVCDTDIDSLLDLNAATLSTAALSGDLADVIGDVAATSQIFAGLSARAKLEITDPGHTAGGFFSSPLLDHERTTDGYTIANGVVIENARGNAGNDLVIGNAAANGLTGNAGNDELYGGSGNDTLDGGAGGDRAFGGLGNDSLTDSGGANFLRGDEGDDVITGGADFDDANGNMGNDTVHGGGGDDWSVGGKDDDLLFGDDGGDVVWGNLGNDTCDGGAGIDQVRGGQGDDVVQGGAGDDFVSGDLGSDTISGGAGADRFHTWGAAGLDRVLDFSLAEGDRVMLDPGTTYTVAQVGADTVISMTGGAQMTLVGVQTASLTSGWIFESWT